jgi:3-phenylpropionate/trans-cinnamate dioxygenase ferredoxin subunit
MNEPKEISITPTDNGPYIVKGPIRLIDMDGHEFEVKGESLALCRCGGSARKPFCDGTRAKIGFQSVARAGQTVA